MASLGDIMEKKKNNWWKAAILSYLILTSGLLISKRMEKEEIIPTTEIELTEQIDNTAVIEEPLQRAIIQYTPPTEEEIQTALQNLNIVRDQPKPGNMYKVLEFADEDRYYHVMIVQAEVNFVTDEEKNITRTYYTIRDAFSKEVLFETFDFSTVMSYTEKFQGIEILSFEDLRELRRIGKQNGMSDELVEAMIPKDINKKTLNDEYVGRLYIMMVRDGSRITYQQLTQEGQKLLKK